MPAVLVLVLQSLMIVLNSLEVLLNERINSITLEFKILNIKYTGRIIYCMKYCVDYYLDFLCNIISWIIQFEYLSFCWRTWSRANAPLSAMIQLKVFNYKKCPFQMKEKAGPALMTTVAMPVFSTKNETVSDWVTVAEITTVNTYFWHPCTLLEHFHFLLLHTSELHLFESSSYISLFRLIVYIIEYHFKIQYII